jgi:branched-chain amino acid transport system substrate-binding protein
MRPTRALARWVLVPLTVTVAAVPFTGCGGKKNTNEIVVGEYGSMTGAQATFGSSTLNGVDLAVNEINASGGIGGKKLKVVSYDDAGKADDATNVAKKLVDDHPVSVIGEVASTLSISAAPTFNQAHIPMISPSSTNTKVTQIGPYIFRVCFIDPFQGYVAAKFATDNLKAKTAAVMVEQTSDYSHGLADVFAQNFAKMGGKIVDTETYVSTDVDFKSALTKIKAANPDIVYIPGYYSNIGPIAKQAREIGLNVPLLGGDGWDSPKLIEGAGGPGKALEGCYFTNHSSMDNPDPTIQNFVGKYENAYNKTKPDALAALAYDAVGVLVDAMKRAGAPADGDYSSQAYRAKVRDMIAATKDYKGVTGDITIDSERNAVKPAVVLQIKGDKEVFVTSVNPS